MQLVKQEQLILIYFSLKKILSCQSKVLLVEFMVAKEF